MKRFFILAIVAVMALSSLGVGYAMWQETLNISGTVNTGTFDIDLSFNPNTGIQELVSGVPEGSTPAAKNVADCSALLASDENSLDITVTNAYPSYTCKVTFDVHNQGTIPAHIHQPKAGLDNPQWTNDDGTPGIALEGCYAQDVQLHNDGTNALCTISIHFSNRDNVAQGAGSAGGPPAYNFNYSIVGHQFNEEF